MPNNFSFYVESHTLYLSKYVPCQIGLLVFSNASLAMVNVSLTNAREIILRSYICLKMLQHIDLIILILILISHYIVYYSVYY